MTAIARLTIRFNLVRFSRKSSERSRCSLAGLKPGCYKLFGPEWQRPAKAFFAS
jgi:hypothetical protein